MDIRIRKLKGTESSSGLSRSLPTSRTFPVTSKSSCFPQCLNTSTDSLNSNSCRSPKLGQYRKLPNKSECDMCHEVLKDVTNLKCLHSACSRCKAKWKIETSGCPLCMADTSDSHSSCSTDQTSDTHLSAEDLIFDDLDLEKDVEHIDHLIYRLETDVLKTLTDKHKQTKDEQIQLTKDAKEQVDKINDHVERLKRLIDEKAENLIKLVQESHTRHMKELEHQERVLRDFKDKLRESLENYRKCNTGGSDNLRQKLEESVRQLSSLSEKIATEDIHIRFSVKAPTDAALDSLVGKVGVRVFLLSSLRTALVHTLTFPATVQAVCPINSHQAWMGYQTCVQLCSKHGSTGPQIDVGNDVQDLCLDENGDLLIASHTSVKVLRDNSVQTLFSCTEPPHGIACRKDGAIITCVRNRVIVYNKEGSQLSEFQCSGSGDLKMPFKVALNINGDVCVTDFQSTTGDVAVFNNSGQMLAKIRTDGMAPRGIACSNQGFIYVSDFRSDRINVYSTHGHFLQSIVTSSQGLSGPLSIALDPSGDLWVGDWKRKVRIFSQGVDSNSSAANSP